MRRSSCTTPLRTISPSPSRTRCSSTHTSGIEDTRCERPPHDTGSQTRSVDETDPGKCCGRLAPSGMPVRAAHPAGGGRQAQGRARGAGGASARPHRFGLDRGGREVVREVLRALPRGGGGGGAVGEFWPALRGGGRAWGGAGGGGPKAPPPRLHLDQESQVRERRG